MYAFFNILRALHATHMCVRDIYISHTHTAVFIHDVTQHG